MKTRFLGRPDARLVVVLAAAAVVVALALASAGSARDKAVTPVAGQTYPLGLTVQGVCKVGPKGPIIGSTYQRWFQGAWSNAAWLPEQGTNKCTDKLDEPGKWRLRIFKADGDITIKIIGPFYVKEGAPLPPNPCDSEETKVVSVSTPNGGKSGLEGLRNKHLSENQVLAPGADVSLDFANGSRMNISKGSKVQLDGCSQPKAPDLPFNIQLSLTLGKIWAKLTPEREHVEIRTERVVCGNRGTIFWISYAPTKQLTTVHVQMGSVWMRRLSGGPTVTVKAGQTGTQQGEEPPSVRRG